MILREATMNDIGGIQLVRNSVLENRLSDPALVPDSDCELILFERGKGWVTEVENTIVGFGIADLVDHNIWALFVHPDHERKGIGRQLHTIMLDWYFTQTNEPVWLSTAPGTRAEEFYRRSGWREVGIHGKNEIKFEMQANEWLIASTRHNTNSIGL
jgi:GNAT superfamily N-acetyltransferase